VGLGAPKPLKPAKGVCTLVSHPMSDPVGRVADSAAPTVRRQGAPEPRVLGALASNLGLGLCLRPGPRTGLGILLIESLVLRRVLEPRVEAGDMLGLAQSLDERCMRAHLKGVSPKWCTEIGREPLTLRVNIPLCYDLIRRLSRLTTQNKRQPKIS
jgi:hypothetical protein